VSRQTAILAYQFGDGLFNMIIPTSGITMGLLEIARIPYSEWMKWIGWFILVMTLISMLLLAVPAMGLIEW
ncbi:MAG: YfcC family protein, partial [Bacteroidetes bacterium]